MNKNSVVLCNRIIAIAAEKGITLKLSRVFLLMYLCNIFSIILSNRKLITAVPKAFSVGPVYTNLLMTLGLTKEHLATDIKKPFSNTLNTLYMGDELLIRTVVNKYADVPYDQLLLSVLSDQSPPVVAYKVGKEKANVNEKESVSFYKKFFISKKLLYT